MDRPNPSRHLRDGRSRPPPAAERAPAGLGPRLLCIEDDEQVRSVLHALLEHDGYRVDSVGTAEDGLSRIQTCPYDLVITDYWLPDRTGAWLLAEADRAGALKHTQVLVITAEHRPQGVENVRVLRKPLDLDDFLSVVHEVLSPVREAEIERLRQAVESTFSTGQLMDGQRLELSLYISASSPSSLRAVRNLQRILAKFRQEQIRLKLVDLSAEPSPEADEDRIAFTPTLVKRQPGPKVWLLGDLEDAKLVEDLLEHSRVERMP